MKKIFSTLFFILLIVFLSDHLQAEGKFSVGFEKYTLPNGFNSIMILKNIYPKGHPYSWDVIGEMEDLTNATVEDVRAFHKKFYSPGNAVLVISGDINKDEVKALAVMHLQRDPTFELKLTYMRHEEHSGDK
jgi:predicted Zn-dependent peptidase